MVTHYRLFTTPRAADYLGVSVSYIKKLIRAGAFPNAVKIGEYDRSPYVIPEEDLKNFRSTWKRNKQKTR